MTATTRTAVARGIRDVWRTARDWPIFTAYILATLAVATIIGLITVDVIDLGMQHFGEAAHRTHDVGYGALFTTLVVGVLAQLRQPQHNVAAMLMALIPSASLLLAAVLVDDLDRVFEFNPLRYAAAIAAVTALLHPAGRAFLRSFRPADTSCQLAAMVVAAAVPLLGYAASNLELQRDVADMHTFMGHYGFMAALSFTIIGVGLVSCLRPRGWRLTAWTTGALAGSLGGTSLLYPDAASSLATGWALGVIAWGAAFVALAMRTDDAPPRGNSAVRSVRSSSPLPLRQP